MMLKSGNVTLHTHQLVVHNNPTGYMVYHSFDARHRILDVQFEFGGDGFCREKGYYRTAGIRKLIVNFRMKATHLYNSGY